MSIDRLFAPMVHHTASTTGITVIAASQDFGTASGSANGPSK